MALTYAFAKTGLLVGFLLGAAWGAAAQVLDSPTPDPVLIPPHVLLKTGLRLTHVNYSSSNQTWRVVVPLSLGAEYRVVPRLAFYGQVETDLQTSRTAARRRQRQAASLPSATLSLGMRYYYNQAHKGEPLRHNNLYGNYLALEGNVERNALAATYANLGRRQTPTSLTPGVYAFWGTQHRLRRAMLYDVNAGLGIQTPSYYNFENVTPAHYNVAAQVNIRLYWGFGL